MSPRPFLLALALLPACCPAPKDDAEPAFPASSASALPYAADPVEPPSVELARDRGTYKGEAQRTASRLDQKVQDASARLRNQPDKARELNEVHWAFVRAFKAVETSDEETFPAARDRFEAATRDLEKKLASP
jgi:hypothetical protein